MYCVRARDARVSILISMVLLNLTTTNEEMWETNGETGYPTINLIAHTPNQIVQLKVN